VVSIHTSGSKNTSRDLADYLLTYKLDGMGKRKDLVKAIKKGRRMSRRSTVRKRKTART